MLVTATSLELMLIPGGTERLVWHVTVERHAARFAGTHQRDGRRSDGRHRFGRLRRSYATPRWHGHVTC